MSLLDPHILILDDNTSDAELAIRELHKAGLTFTVQCVPDKESFFEALCEFVPDLILTDYHLPGIDGLTVLALARRIYEHIPVIIISGSIGEETAIEALKSGATDYILKPGFGRLGPAVDRALKENWLRLKCKETEEELKRSEERFRATFANAAVGIEQVDEDGRLLEVNPALCAILGYTRDELLKRTFSDLTHPDDRQQEMAPLAQLFRGEIPSYQIEKRYLNKRGQPIWVRVTSSLAQGSRSYRISIVEDITAHRRAREALRVANERLAEADRRKDEFLAMLAHELRNPLAPIRYAVQMLNMAGNLQGRQQKQRDVIDRQVSHMSRLLDDLLDVSRITRGKIQLRKEKLDLRLIAEQVVESMRAETQERRLHLWYQAPSVPLAVEGDPTRLEQILRNLLQNAAKYTEPGGSIWMLVEMDARGSQAPHAVVRVRDTGIGIAPEVLPLIFDLFAQAEQALDHSQGGLGIGLTMVKRLVELHGGRVEARSEGLGRGSEFIVRLPLVEAVMLNNAGVAGGARPERTEAPSTARRILVVDDNEDSAASLAELLCLWGYEVRTAHDGPQALAAVQEWRPEVILLDIGLPGMDGYEVARRLRQNPDSAAIWMVALTGYGTEEDRRRAQEAGFDHHLVKPVSLDELSRLLARPAAA